jgi:hypothetical protein
MRRTKAARLSWIWPQMRPHFHTRRANTAHLHRESQYARYSTGQGGGSPVSDSLEDQINVSCNLVPRRFRCLQVATFLAEPHKSIRTPTDGPSNAPSGRSSSEPTNRTENYNMPGILLDSGEGSCFRLSDKGRSTLVPRSSRCLRET